jgi:hypothetical protein
MGLDEREGEEFGLLVTLAGVLFGGFLAFVLLFPTSLASSLVLVSALATVVAALGFSTVFTVRHDALAASRVHDAEIVRRVSRSARREQNLPIDDALAATSELWFSSWYRDVARERTPAAWLLVYSAAGFAAATVAAIAWGLQLPWGILFCLSGGLAFLAFVLTRVDLRELLSPGERRLGAKLLVPLVSRDIKPRWKIAQMAIAYDPRIRRMSAELESRPLGELGSLDDLLSVVSGQGWWMDSGTNHPRE